MRKIFLDCGANNGSSVRHFRSVVPGAAEYEIFSFEPNPGLIEKNFPIDGVVLIPKAISDADGVAVFHTTNFTTCTSGTLSNIKGKNYKHKIEVEMIDLSKWIINNFDIKDNIILKLDVEGAEYAVLNKMFADKSIEYINEIHGELHNRKCGKTKDDDKKIVDTLAKFGLVLYEWDATTKIPFKNTVYGNPYKNPKWPKRNGKRI